MGPQITKAEWVGLALSHFEGEPAQDEIDLAWEVYETTCRHSPAYAAEWGTAEGMKKWHALDEAEQTKLNATYLREMGPDKALEIMMPAVRHTLTKMHPLEDIDEDVMQRIAELALEELFEKAA